LRQWTAAQAGRGKVCLPIDVKLDANVGWREAVGRGSGEAFQLKMNGQGTVFVQASEERL